MSGTGTPAIDAADIAYLHDVVRKANSSFTAGMRVLPRARRDALFSVYAFCREVDDIADEPGEPEAKRLALSAWRVRIDGICVGEADGPLARTLVAATAGYGLRREDFHAVINGMEMDAAPRVRIADDAELSLYCDRVACAVGRLCVRIFGMDENTGDRRCSLPTSCAICMKTPNRIVFTCPPIFWLPMALSIQPMRWRCWATAVCRWFAKSSPSAPRFATTNPGP